MADDLVTLLSGAGAAGADVGGKGAWLDRLLAAGFRIPPTAVLTTTAYERVAAVDELAPLLARLRREPPPPPERHAADRAAIDEAFLAAPLPEEVAAALRTADQAVRAVDGRVAARSSATAEDLHGTSFAGQYRSVLDLDSVEALERACRLVWASLWHPAPRAYRHFHGVDESRLAMAVVVMRQLAARSAGVAFTVDPGGAVDTVRVEAVEGLGEALVSGAVTPTVHLVDRRRCTIDVHAPVTPDAEPDVVAVAVASLAVAVETAFGEPQDVEWAIDDDGLWLLQARPITTGAGHEAPDDDGFDTVGHETRDWTSAGIAEMLPGVLPPLRWDTCRPVLEEAIRSFEARLDPLPAEAATRPFVGRVGGRAMLDAALLELLADRQTRPERGIRRGGPVARWRVARRALGVRRRGMWEGGAMTVAAAEVAEHLSELATLDTAELVTLRWRLVDLAGRAMTAEATVAAAAATGVDRLRSLLRHHLDEGEADRWAAAVTARPGGAVAGWPVESLRSVLDSATPAVRDALAGARSWDDATAAIEPIEGGPATLAGLRHALRTAGSAAVLAGPTWEERPAALWPALRTLLTDDPTPRRDPALPTPLDDLIDGLKANPSWRQTRILTGQLVDVRAQVLRRTAEDASDLLERRERTKAAVLAIGGALRRVHLELGRRLVAAGQLETVEDVELLGLDELLAAAGGSDSGSSVATSCGSWPRAAGVSVPTLAELARRRRWLESSAQETPPRRPTGGAEHRVRRGLGASPGRVRGRARVLHTSDTGSLQRGEVLIARTTDASWAPLFMVAAGVVVEEGGPLSHAAIVARELGIPAVLAVPDIVATLDGRAVAVTVDGDVGTVTIDDEAPDPEGGLT